MAQTAQKQTAEYAKSRLDALVRSGGRYGVPVIVLRPEDAGLPAKLRPERYEVHGRTGHVFRKPLDTREVEFIENSLDMLLPRAKAALNKRDQLYDWVKNSWIKMTALGGAYAVTLPKPGKTADQLGPNAYREKDLTCIMLSHTQTSKKDWLEMFLHDPDSVDEGKIPGTGVHWNVWVLEHEMAHSAGAGEAQADLMAAAQYTRSFDDDTLPRVMADIRAVNAVMRHANDEYSQRYGWAPVAAVDALLAGGKAKVKAMSQKDIHALRFSRFASRQDDIDSFSGALARNGVWAFFRESMPDLIKHAQKALDSDELKNKQGAREIGERFIAALRRLSNTPAPKAAYRPKPKLAP